MTEILSVWGGDAILPPSPRGQLTMSNDSPTTHVRSAEVVKPCVEMTLAAV